MTQVHEIGFGEGGWLYKSTDSVLDMGIIIFFFQERERSLMFQIRSLEALPINKTTICVRDLAHLGMHDHYFGFDCNHFTTRRAMLFCARVSSSRFIRFLK